jgi:hypothetical protein
MFDWIYKWMPGHQTAWVSEKLDIIQEYTTGQQLCNYSGETITWEAVRRSLIELYNHIYFGTIILNDGMQCDPYQLRALLARIQLEGRP